MYGKNFRLTAHTLLSKRILLCRINTVVENENSPMYGSLFGFPAYIFVTFKGKYLKEQCSAIFVHEIVCKLTSF